MILIIWLCYKENPFKRLWCNTKFTEYTLRWEFGCNINSQVVWSWHCSDEVQCGSTEDPHETIRTSNKDVLVTGRNCVRTVCLLARRTKPNMILVRLQLQKYKNLKHYKQIQNITKNNRIIKDYIQNKTRITGIHNYCSILSWYLISHMAQQIHRFTFRLVYIFNGSQFYQINPFNCKFAFSITDSIHWPTLQQCKADTAR